MLKIGRWRKLDWTLDYRWCSRQNLSSYASFVPKNVLLCNLLSESEDNVSMRALNIFCCTGFKSFFFGSPLHEVIYKTIHVGFSCWKKPNCKNNSKTSSHGPSFTYYILPRSPIQHHDLSNNIVFYFEGFSITVGLEDALTIINDSNAELGLFLYCFWHGLTQPRRLKR